MNRMCSVVPKETSCLCLNDTRPPELHVLGHFNWPRSPKLAKLGIEMHCLLDKETKGVKTQATQFVVVFAPLALSPIENSFSNTESILCLNAPTQDFAPPQFPIFSNLFL